ncbi:hypothetical protein KSP39_PZI008684 [Platanthera zijinensis]|uniref:Uncharacterized protein n=1 Tax=Platanthera zijinensis TaxID=2320716 RepID=A0AAP0BP06_9ASPA
MKSELGPKLAVASLNTDETPSSQTIDHNITPHSGRHLPQFEPPQLDFDRHIPLESQRHPPRLLLLLQRRADLAPQLRLAVERRRHRRLVPVALVEHREAPRAQTRVPVPNAQPAAVLVVDSYVLVRVGRRDGEAEAGASSQGGVDGEGGDAEPVDGVCGELGAEDEVEDAGGGGDGYDDEDEGEKGPADAAAAAAAFSFGRAGVGYGWYGAALGRQLVGPGGVAGDEGSGGLWGGGRRSGGGLEIDGVDPLLLCHGTQLSLSLSLSHGVKLSCCQRTAVYNVITYC